MTDTKTLKLFRKQAMTNLETELNAWINGDGFGKDDVIEDGVRVYNFLTNAIKRKTKAPAYNKLKKEVIILIKWGALYDAFGYAIIKRYGYETYLKLHQDLDILESSITLSYAEDYICCYM